MYRSVILYLIIWLNSLSGYCETWNQGLNYSLDYSEQYCQIEQPKYCWNIYLDGVLNMSKNKKCTLDSIDKLQHAKELFYQNYGFDTKQNIKYIGWESSQNFNTTTRLSEPKLSRQLVKTSKKYKTLQEAKDDHKEIIIDVDNQVLHINMERKDEIIKERQTIQNSDSMAKNIICIFMDTVSRQQFLRKLPKTAQFLKKYGNFESQEYQTENLQAKSFEFFRFHAIDKFTYNNEFVMSFNDTMANFQKYKNKYSKKDKKQSILAKFQKAGYITGLTANGAGLFYPIKTARKYEGEYLYDYYEISNPDHEFLFYDPNYFSAKSYWGFYKGNNSIFRRCAYGKDTNQFMFEYARKFMETYRNEKKVIYIELQDGHDATSEVLQYVDEHYYNFLKFLEDDGFLQKDTMLFNFADHGNHFGLNPANQGAKACSGNNCNLFNNYIQERMLPALFMLHSNNVLEKYKNYNQYSKTKLRNNFEVSYQNDIIDTLMHNQQPIISMWQLHNTVMCAAFGIQQEYCQDSLFYPVQNEKSCKDINMSIMTEFDTGMDKNLDYCVCYPRK